MNLPWRPGSNVTHVWSNAVLSEQYELVRGAVLEP